MGYVLNALLKKQNLSTEGQNDNFTIHTFNFELIGQTFHLSDKNQKKERGKPYNCRLGYT